jgi:linoleoyl-CoA desaturase
MSIHKTIKFQEDIKSDLFYGALKHEVFDYLKVNMYDGYATPFVLLKGAFYLTLFFGSYGLLISGTLPFPNILIVWGVMGILGILVGLNVSHDAAHNSLFKSKKCNRIVYNITFSMLGANAYLWQLRHIDSHHLFPNVDNCDADIDDNSMIRLSIYKDIKWYHRFQWLYAPVLYLFYTLQWVFYKDFIILFKKQLANLRNIHHPTEEIFLFYLGKIFYLVIYIALPLFLTTYSWEEVFIGFLLMHLTSSYAFIFGLIPSHFSDLASFERVDKDGYLKRSWAKHQMATSVDYHADQLWANFIFGGFNAHVAHHLFPTISHIHYPAISKIIVEISTKFDIPYQNISWFGAIKSHFRFLKKLGAPYPVS